MFTDKIIEIVSFGGNGKETLMEHWTLTWAEFMAILGAIAIMLSILSWVGRIINNKYSRQENYTKTTLSIQSDLESIKSSVSEIKNKMETNNAAVIELAKDLALRSASLKAAWREIEKIQENCKDIQNDKRKERLS